MKQSNKTTNGGTLSVREVTPEGIVIAVEYNQHQYTILFTEAEVANLLDELIPAYIKLAWDPLSEF